MEKPGFKRSLSESVLCKGCAKQPLKPAALWPPNSFWDMGKLSLFSWSAWQRWSSARISNNWWLVLKTKLIVWIDLSCTKPAFLEAQMVKHLPAMQETWVQSLDQEDPLEKEMATHSSTFAWKIPWMEKPGRLQSMRSQRVPQDWATLLSLSQTC